MELEHAKEATVTSNLPSGDITAMTIDLEAMPHLMNVLTNLYNNPTLAVVREYFCNALDAHVAIGNTSPVSVTLPSWDSPVYVVTDQGIGMTSDNIRKIYAQYGASTKRKSNTQIGAFGLGCKSALTITNQFTVISVKDGEKTVALISKTESGINSINIISSTQTEESSGTTVKIPVSDINLFNREAEKFFKFVDEGVVLVDELDPSGFFSTLEEIKVESTEASTYLSYGNEYNKVNVVVMGNVAYGVSHSDLSTIIVDNTMYKMLTRTSLYLRAGIGDVDLTPNREGLRLTDKTTEFIKTQLVGTYESLRQVALAEMDAITERSECFEVQRKWSRYNFDLQWKGEDIPKRVESEFNIKHLSRDVDTSASYTDNTFYIHPSSEATIITDLDPADFAKVSRQLLAYTRSRGLDDAQYYITTDPKILTNKWICENKNFTFVTCEEVREAAKAQRKIDRAARESSGATSEAITYPVLDMATKIITFTPYKEIPSGAAYMAREDFKSSTADNMRESLSKVGRDHTHLGVQLHALLSQVTDAAHVILVGKQRTEAALLGRVKTAYSLRIDMEKAYDKLAKMQADPAIVTENATSDYSDVSDFKYLGLDKPENLDQILDEDLKSALTVVNSGPSPAMDAVNKLQKTISTLRLRDKYTSEIPEPTAPPALMADRYPLMRHIGWGATKYGSEIVAYLNASYEALQARLAESSAA